MHSGKPEVEAKFHLPALEDLRGQILQQGGHEVIERHLERNWRFDHAGGELTADGKVLRLRTASPDANSLTFKSGSAQFETRQELEVKIGDPAAAVDFLQALGYQVIWMYEKYREVYALTPCSLMLDELPFGHFLEIEAPSLSEVQAMATRLQLRWESRVSRSYHQIFQRLAQIMELASPDATFDSFQAIGRPDFDLVAQAAA